MSQKNSVDEKKLSVDIVNTESTTTAVPDVVPSDAAQHAEGTNQSESGITQCLRFCRPIRNCILGICGFFLVIYFIAFIAGIGIFVKSASKFTSKGLPSVGNLRVQSSPSGYNRSDHI